MNNKKIKEQLISLYGNSCMFEKAKIAEKIAARGGIRTFKSFQIEKRFKGQKLSYQLTVHHLQHVSEGGKSSIDNTSIISEAAHQYIHSLPRMEEEYINNCIREFKIACMSIYGNGTVTNNKIIDFQYGQNDTDFISIPLYENKPVKKKRKNIPFSRARNKNELQRLIKEYEEEER